MPKQEIPSRARHKRVKRVVVRHQWNSREEWVRTLDDLCELNDSEIDDLARMVANDAGGHPDDDE